MCFENKVVFITGANGGLAKSFIEALLKENAKKIYCTARDLEKLAELKKLSSKIEIFNLDITKKDELFHNILFFYLKLYDKKIVFSDRYFFVLRELERTFHFEQKKVVTLQKNKYRLRR